MARPPLPLGTHGNIWVVKRGNGYLARCRYRDLDGTTRYLERAGSSKTAANRNLQDALRAFRGPTDEPLRPEHRFERAAKLWLVKVEAWVADGELVDTTADRYRRRERRRRTPGVLRWARRAAPPGHPSTTPAGLTEPSAHLATVRPARAHHRSPRSPTCCVDNCNTCLLWELRASMFWVWSTPKSPFNHGRQIRRWTDQHHHHAKEEGQ